jgi:deoxyribonuclease IV
MLILGSHTVDNGGIHMAVKRAANSGLNAVQIFSAKPQFYNEKIGVRPERAARFKEALAETGIKPQHVLIHAAYVLSVATPDDTKYERAKAGLAKEVERAATLGAAAVCFHPGSAGTGDRGESAKRIAKAISDALKSVDGDTRLLIENTAGAGRTMGKTAAEIGEMLANVPSSLRSRTGYGLDTCHLFSSGFPIHESRERLVEVLDEFEEATGEAPSFFHLNDSEGALGSNKDRHVLIGDGEIGKAPFGWLLRDRRAKKVPLILETPQLNYDVAEDDDSPDPYDVQMAALLRSLTDE